MNDTQKDALNKAIDAYETARTQATAEFDAFWASHVSNTATDTLCVGPMALHVRCGANATPPPDPDPESEDETARKVILAPIPGELPQVSFGRWMRLLGMAEEADDEDGERYEQLGSLCTVAYRLAVLNFSEPGGVRVTEVDAEQTLQRWAKDAEL